jgi:16S rRNA (cytosine967-C5)-methyltransferase
MVLKPGQPISHAREAALAALSRVREGWYAENALARQLDAGALASTDRALATELVYGVLRWQTRLDGIVARFLRNPRKGIPPLLRDILRLAVYQLIFMDRIPDHAAVAEAVLQAKARLGTTMGGLTNGVLRNLLRREDRGDVAPDESPEGLAQFYSHPLWLVHSWMEAYGTDRTRALLEHNNTRGLLVLRANTLKTSREALLALLERHGISANPHSNWPDAVIIRSLARPVADIPGFADGLFAVQDPASQLIASLVAPQEGETILDACAAPGGKTAHIAALAQNKLKLVAVDADPRRVEDMRTNLHRLGVTCANVLHGDMLDTEFSGSLGSFDRVLVDAACSNLGVLRHNPELKYRVGPETVRQRADRQADLLRSAIRLVRPGGMLVYSVCTTTPEETTEVVDLFLLEYPHVHLLPFDAAQVPSPAFLDSRGCLLTLPPFPHEPLDGFFAARFATP